jgi:Tfp pilus assembly major pilin PilA
VRFSHQDRNPVFSVVAAQKIGLVARNGMENCSVVANCEDAQRTIDHVHLVSTTSLLNREQGCRVKIGVPCLEISDKC